MAWLGVKLYYAAFYAAHALLRMQGTSCTQLDGREVFRIRSVARAYGAEGSDLLSAGYYYAAFDPSQNIIELNKANAQGGGSHEILWARYNQQIANLVRLVEQSDLLIEDKRPIVIKLKDLQRALGTRNFVRGNWLSAVRNEINYRHAHGVWYPHSHKTDPDDYIRLVRQSLTRDPAANDLPQEDTFDAFVKCCIFVIALTKSTVTDMASRHPEKRSFQNDGPMKVLRYARLGAAKILKA
jgi:hypothetical protein